MAQSNDGKDQASRPFSAHQAAQTLAEQKKIKQARQRCALQAKEYDPSTNKCV